MTGSFSISLDMAKDAHIGDRKETKREPKAVVLQNKTQNRRANRSS